MAGILSIQFGMSVEDRSVNLRKVAELIEKNKDKKLDLVLLPEFFLNSASNHYFENPVDKDGGEPLKFLSELARKYNTNIACGSIVVKENNKLFNRMFVLNRKGETVAKYDKIHLFKYHGGTEDANISEGNQHVVAELDFAKVGLSICFDIKYPMHFRKLIQMGAEIIVAPTAWGYPTVNKEKEELCTKKAFESINITRAFENNVYFVTSNQCGQVGDDLTLIGHSMITSPMAAVLQNALEKECAIYADVDLEVVRELKKTYPVADIE